MEFIILPLIVVGIGVGAYFYFFRKKSSSAPVTVPAVHTPDGIWHIDFSTGMPATLVDNQSFTFPQAPNSIHCVETAPVWPGRGAVTVNYHIDADATTQFVSTQDPTVPANVTMYIQRNGDNLTAVGPMASYRFYCGSQSTALAPGDFTMSAAFDPTLWTNVYGLQDPVGLQACLADLANVGIVFGAPSIGATAHGAQVQGGSATFTLTGFTLT